MCAVGERYNCRYRIDLDGHYRQYSSWLCQIHWRHSDLFDLLDLGVLNTVLVLLLVYHDTVVHSCTTSSLLQPYVSS